MRRQRPLAAALLVLSCLVGAAAPGLAAQGKHGAVAADHLLASRVGVDILRSGGNAVDAAVATSFAVCVVNPTSCGIGGGGFALVYLATERRTVALDYRETAPAAAGRDMFVRDGKAIPDLSRKGGLAVGIPGDVRGMAALLAKFGSRPLAEVLAPAIRLAAEGFPAGDHLARSIAENRAAIAAVPGLARNLLHPDGTPKRAGETITFPELARTLRRIAAEGPDAFYTGAIAEQIVAAARKAGGVLSLADLAGYQPVWREPIALDFEGYRVIGMPPPSSAGVVLQVLGMLDGDDLAQLGHDSAAYGHLLAEAMKHGFADRAKVYGDTEVPLATLLAPATLGRLRQKIRPHGVLPIDQYGSFTTTPGNGVDDSGTSHLSVMDGAGNAVALTTTINTTFGAYLVAGDTGILLNNEMDDFSAQPGVPNAFGLIGAEANAIAPGKRPLSSMSPTIVTRDDRAILALGGSGGPLILTGTLQVLLNQLVFGMSPDESVAAPRLHHQWAPPVLAVETEVADAQRRQLAALGHTVRPFGPMAAIQSVRRTADGFDAAADPRKGGKAAAW